MVRIQKCRINITANRREMNIMITIFFIVVVFCIAYRVSKLEHRIIILEKVANNKSNDMIITTGEECKETEASRGMHLNKCTSI